MAITKESNSQQLRSMQGPTLRAEATFVDPAVTQLFQMENELARLGSGKVEDRQPSRIEIIIPSPPTNRD